MSDETSQPIDITRHTAGPYEVGGSYGLPVISVGDALIICHMSAADYFVAQLGVSEEEAKAIRDANAALLAIAPITWLATQAFSRYLLHLLNCETCQASIDCADGTALWGQAIDINREAIKASVSQKGVHP